MKGQKGITLVALVITIIVLLILAGVTIYSLSNTNIFGKAQNAAGKYNNAAKDENTTITTLENYLNTYVK